MPKEKKEVEKSVAGKEVEAASAVPPAKSGKKTRKARCSGYGKYLRGGVLAALDPDIGSTAEATAVMNGVAKDVFYRITQEAAALCRTANRTTLGVKQLQHAGQICNFGDELWKRAETFANAAVAKYDRAKKKAAPAKKKKTKETSETEL